jgi:hypothetical protein
MKVDAVLDWSGQPLKEGKFSGSGPFEVSGQDIIDLCDSWDVAIHHVPQQQPTRRQQRAGVPPVPDCIAILLDTKGGRHRQR